MVVVGVMAKELDNVREKSVLENQSRNDNMKYSLVIKTYGEHDVFFSIKKM